MDTPTGTLTTYKMFIGGEWVEAASGETFPSDNPFTGKPWALIPRGGARDADRAVRAAHDAFTSGEWPKLNASKRGALLRKLGDLIAEKAKFLAAVEVRDNGKLFAEMSAQTAYMAQWYYYYGGLADKIEGHVIPTDKPDMLNYTRYEPLGVIAAITPWNSPLLLTAWKLAPALAAGNTMVLKPSEFTSASVLEFMKLIEQAGFPPGVVNVVTGFGADVGMPLVEHPLVAKVAFTGSDRTGTLIYQTAAKGLKRVSMELGGKSPNIVFDDAHLENAIKGVVSGIFAATGQTCIAGSRLLVQSSIHDQFVDKLVAFAKTATMGDPMNLDTQVGPVTNPPQYKKILDYIDIAKGEGAKAVLGGGKATRPECGDGWFVEPTIFTGVKNSMRIAQEEVFGPVLAIQPYDDEEGAIRIANATVYGLSSHVQSADQEAARRVARQIRAGQVHINYPAWSGYAPFGGYRMSGNGREYGRFALEEYLEVKAILGY